ncbi:MAG: protein kinase [Chloroflexota bacterium]|nr:protein kinase [Chloroflexota bacterium]
MPSIPSEPIAAPAPAMPTGTVTFLFTDIEGSTHLLHELRDQYATVLADQRTILRAASEKWNGREMDTQGDSFFIAFSRAVEAIGAVIDAQRALAAHVWPRGATVRVRMGLHTGEPIIGPTGYVGIDVHRAARICAVGHGGQVLLSQTTRELVAHDLPAGVSLRDLGEYRLKDIEHGERLFQLVIADLPADFPALKSTHTFPRDEVVGASIQDRYRTISEIGRGGMGVVYRGHDTVLDRDVAVKLLSALSLTDDARARLLREAQAAAQLNHPNIASVYDAGEADGVPFIVMELVDGPSLRDRPPETIAEIVRVAHQLSAALDHAHAHGIIHRDVKPENVLLAPDGTAKLMDFGLARVSASHLTEEGAVVGTVSYISPEQLMGKDIDGRTDLYSLGSLLYELLTRRAPFIGDHPMAVISQQLYTPPAPPSTLRADIPPALEDIILKLLAKDPKDRYASARDLEIALDEMTESSQVRAPAAPRHNLPIPLNSFIGRAGEIAQVKRLLGEARLVSLTGSGGCGKTRLALQVANEIVNDFPDGAWLVELATLSDPAVVPHRLASVLGLREEATRPVMETLTTALSAHSLLLLLDNCEHMIDTCALLAETLLQACPNLRLLTTSREALGIAGETTFRVPSLSLPDPRHLPPPEQLTQYDAVHLFVDRAASVSPDFSLTEHNALPVAQICRRLDGIPLAIELAAARVKGLSVDQIATRLDDRFRLLTGGSRTALPRQQTLRALIDWSYGLLSDPERLLLRRLSVFAGGWTLEAAEAICACGNAGTFDVMDLQLRLVDKSLVVAEKQDDETRYRLLETIRQYARDRLVESGDVELLRACHLDYFLQFAEQAEPKLRGREQVLWSERLNAEYDNLRTALEWAFESNRAEIALRFAVALWQFWEMRNYFSDSRAWLERALAAPVDAPAPIRARALLGLGRLDKYQGNFIDARPRLEASAALFRDLGDQENLARVVQAIGEVAAELGDLATARLRFEEALALFKEQGNQRGMAAMYLSQGELARVQGDYDRAAALYTASLALLEALGEFRRKGTALYNLGKVALHQGDHARAAGLYRDSLSIGQRLGNKFVIAHCLAALAGVAAATGQPARAAKLSGATDALLQSIHAQLDLADRIDYENSLEAVRAQIVQTAFEAARAEGSGMSLEQAIAYALEEP